MEEKLSSILLLFVQIFFNYIIAFIFRSWLVVYTIILNFQYSQAWFVNIEAFTEEALQVLFL